MPKHDTRNKQTAKSFQKRWLRTEIDDVYRFVRANIDRTNTIRFHNYEDRAMTLKRAVQDNHTTLELKEVVVIYHYHLVITVFLSENH